MKNIMILAILFMAVGMADAALTECTKVSGNCNVISSTFYNQTYHGATIENISVNVTVNGTSATETGSCRVACVTEKAYGNFTHANFTGNWSDTSTWANVTFCNVGARVAGTTAIAPVNQTATATQCNSTFDIGLSGGSNIVVEYKPKETRANSTRYPLIVIGSTAIAGATAVAIWLKRRRT